MTSVTNIHLHYRPENNLWNKLPDSLHHPNQCFIFTPFHARPFIITIITFTTVIPSFVHSKLKTHLLHKSFPPSTAGTKLELSLQTLNSFWTLCLQQFFLMAALRSRCGHYIFALWFLPFFLSFFPRLISAVGDWMSTIVPHMVWP